MKTLEAFDGVAYKEGDLLQGGDWWKKRPLGGKKGGRSEAAHAQSILESDVSVEIKQNRCTGPQDEVDSWT